MRHIRNGRAIEGAPHSQPFRRWTSRAWPAIALTAIALLAFWGGILLHRRHSRQGFIPRGPDLQIAFPDVGGGDCMLVRDPVTGRCLLVDAGPDSAAAEEIVACMHQDGASTLAAVVLASPRSGSLGGLPALLSLLRFHGVVLLPCTASEFGSSRNGACREALAALHAHGIRAWPALRYLSHFPNPLGADSRARLSCLLVPNASGDTSANGAPDMAVRIDYGASAVLDTAPLTPTEETQLLSQDLTTGRGGLTCDVLCVAAGGAERAASSEFLAVAAPRVAAISDGSDRPAAADTLERLHAADVRIGETRLLRSFSLRLSRFPDQPILWISSKAAAAAAQSPAPGP